MAATVIANRKLFTTAQDEVAHKRLMQNKWYPGGAPAAAIENEDEVKFIGQECYVPRLVAANVPIVKSPAADQGAPIKPQATGYAEPLQAKRPHFLRGQSQGMPASGLPSGGGALPKGKGAGKGQETAAKESTSAFPFNLLSGPGM
eukprot:TRINITY_DN27628_c0_g1_i1.p1 TRINITY_DN27628_c0_g1~~TRINITY_DN27628_c0_g1_i1.p1  ORF type:complete len:146 (-),score=40.91 TRINITY_DN27628_c0_g1_i1:141-578(-)